MSAPTFGRKASVQIEEPVRTEESSSAGTKIPAASVKTDPKLIEQQLQKSIPDKERTIVKDWKVKQVVITKLDQGQGSGPAVTGVNVAPSAVPPMLGRLKKQGTSKMHKFSPVVSLDQAITWLSEYGNADSSILFENNCAFMFERGAFLEFEDIRDDEDE